MGNYKDNKIEFNNILIPLINDGAPGPSASFTPDELSSAGLDYYTDRTTISDELKPLYFSSNAIDIHWGGAKLGNKVDSATLTPGEEIIIQTTGQLLSYMSTIAQKLTNLENILINL